MIDIEKIIRSDKTDNALRMQRNSEERELQRREINCKIKRSYEKVRKDDRENRQRAREQHLNENSDERFRNHVISNRRTHCQRIFEKKAQQRNKIDNINKESSKHKASAEDERCRNNDFNARMRYCEHVENAQKYS